jgi:TolB-like protein
LKTLARTIRLTSIAIALWCLPAIALAAPAKIAIIPFQINAEKEYDFLRKGIVQMLASRLSQADKVEVIDSTATDQAVNAAKGVTGDGLALHVGRDLQVDYIVSGSVTLLGESVSIDAKVLDVTGVRSPMTFFKQTQGMGTVISQIDALAAEINTRYFGRQAQAAVPPAPAPAAPAPAPLPPTDIHAHPEKLLQEDRVTETAPKPAVQPAPQSSLRPSTLGIEFALTSR